jgi:CRISPR/Cas system-associated exonuclease Cas4 (RecB family)
MLYLHLAQLLYPELDLQKIIYIYEWKPTQEVKEFVVNYNPALISLTLDISEAVAAALLAGEPPSRPPWAEEMKSKGCKDCEYRRTCWGVTAAEANPAPTFRVKRAAGSARRKALRP